MKITYYVFIIALFTTAHTVPPPPLPAGSYKASCVNCSILNNLLTCQCHTGHQVNTSSLSLPCMADITTINGILQCLPLGSYRSSCTFCTYNHIMHLLTCTCKNQFSPAIPLTSINTTECQPGHDIANVDGVLTCE